MSPNGWTRSRKIDEPYSIETGERMQSDMKTLDFTKPYAERFGQFPFPGAVYIQDGLSFNRAGDQVFPPGEAPDEPKPLAENKPVFKLMDDLPGAKRGRGRAKANAISKLDPEWGVLPGKIAEAAAVVVDELAEELIELDEEI